MPVIVQLGSSEHIGALSAPIHHQPSIESDRRLLGRRRNLHSQGDEVIGQALGIKFVLESPHLISQGACHRTHHHRASDEACRGCRPHPQRHRHHVGSSVQLFAGDFAQLGHVLPNQHGTRLHLQLFGHLTGLQHALQDSTPSCLIKTGQACEAILA